MSFAAATISALTGLLTFYSVDGSQRLFQTRVKVDILTISPKDVNPIAKVNINNKSALLLDTASIFVKLTNSDGKQSEGRLTSGDLAPDEEKEYSIKMNQLIPEEGTKIELCVEAAGPLPMTKAFWKKEYQYAKFVPPAGGHPICEHGSAEILQYKTLPPEILAEQEAGCVMPEFANPLVDYVPMTFSLDQISGSQNWGIPIIIQRCG